MEKKEFIEAKDRLSLVTEAKDVLRAYGPSNGDTWVKLATVARLFEIQGYNEIIAMLDGVFGEFSKNYDCLKCFLSIIRANSKEIADTQFLGFIIKFLLDVACSCPCQYECFITCQAISSIVVKNKFLPPNPVLKVFFLKVSKLFKENNQFLGYLNSLHILNEIEKVDFSKEEFDFIKKCAEVKSEKFPRDLFCGFKAKDVNSLVVGSLSNDPDFVPDPKWKAVLEAAEQDSRLDFDENSEASMELVSFMRKNDICYEIKDKKIKIVKRPFDGFTTKVFNIIRTYEPKAESGTADIIEEIKLSSPAKDEVKPKPVIKNEAKPVVFTNRFASSLKKYKALCRYAPIKFQDNFYCQRNQHKLDGFTLSNNLFEEDKSLLLRSTARIESLHNSLVKLMAERQSRLELENREKRKKEEEARAEEENAKKWFNQPRRPIGQGTAIPKSQPSWFDKKDASEKSSNIYVPKITTFDLNSVSESLNAIGQSTTDDSSSNRPYVPKSTTSDLHVSKQTTSDPSRTLPNSPPAGSSLYKFDMSKWDFKDDKVKSKSTSWHKFPEAKNKQQDQKQDN